ncbi:MAG: hypothetical protein QG632_22 [Candidatus Dependentiae bacterium]|nr:hypothetical protein [Candidatus Dependentiae bacterium]
MIIALLFTIFSGLSGYGLATDAPRPLIKTQFHHMVENSEDVTPLINVLAAQESHEELKGLRNMTEVRLRALASDQNKDLDNDEEERLENSRQRYHSAIANAELRSGAKENVGAQRARKLMDVDKQDSNFKNFVRREKGKVGLGAYALGDSFLQSYEATKLARSLKGKTPHEVEDGFKDMGQSIDGVNSLETVMRYVRPVTKVAYGVMPFANTLSRNKYVRKLFPGEGINEHVFTPPQNTANKALGALNLAALGSNLIHNVATRHNAKLNGREAYLLSYLNRRYGTPTDIIEYRKTIKKLAKTRFITQMLGQYAAPVLLSLLMPNLNKKDSKTAFSPAMAVANTAGILDSLLGMWQRHKTQKLIKSIKKVTPLIEEELLRNPPTLLEREADKIAAGNFSMDGF